MSKLDVETFDKILSTILHFFKLMVYILLTTEIVDYGDWINSYIPWTLPILHKALTLVYVPVISFLERPYFV